MTDEFAALLDNEPPVRARRPDVDPEVLQRRAIRAAAQGRSSLVAADLVRPVTRTFLGEVFGMKAETIKKRLAKCPFVGEEVVKGHKVQLYNFKTACEYLLKPKMDITTYLRSMNTADMPPIIAKALWEAERTKNRVLIETGDSWSTPDVLEVLGVVFMLINNRVPLIVESMRDEGLTDAQLVTLENITAQFQKDLHEELVELPKQRQTPSRRAAIEQMVDTLTEDTFGGDDE